jgi:Protein of unknown function (DUF1217)
MVSTYTNYQLVSRDLARSISNVKNEPMVARETKYYIENIAKVKSIEDFVSDRRLLNYAMKAHGLGDMSYAKAFVAKVLKEGRDERDSFVNRLADPRYSDFAETFDFSRHGELATSFTKAQQGVVDKYIRQTLEEKAGADNEGVRLSLYFQRKAPKLTTVTQILADKAVATVVRTALGIPASTALLNIDKQVEQLSKRIDIKDFSDPEKLSKFISRFAVLWDVENAPQDQSSGPGLLFNQSAAQGLSGNLIMALQKLQR